MTGVAAASAAGRQPAGGPSAWRPADLPSADWVLEATAGMIRDLERAAELARADRSGSGPSRVGTAVLDASVLRALAEDIERRLFEGCGFALLRGLPVDGPQDRAVSLLWALGCQLGQPLPQNHHGDLLDHVRDEGVATVRGAKTSRALVYHTDFAGVVPDVFGLLSIRTARSGGESLLVSGHTVHDELLRQRPDLVDRLCHDFWFDRSADVGPDEPPVFRAPVFSRASERVTVLYNRARIHRGHRLQAESLTREDLEALDQLDTRLSSALNNLRFILRPGDLLLVNNAAVLHNRTAFEDHEESVRKRLLLRIWLRRGC